MNTSDRHWDSQKVALVVGVGGLGCPAALALARAGVRLVLCDDDEVAESNLARQILFSERDVGRNKLDAARDALLEMGASSVERRKTRLLPETAARLVGEADLVVEGADNFATKFLAADAAFLGEKPIVHGAGIRWHGTVLSVAHRGRPCYRCLFEDLLPASAAPNCAEAGVMGPVVGFLGGLMADLAIDLAMGDTSRTGEIWSFDGKSNRLRKTSISSRPDCLLCGASATIHDLTEHRYLGPRSLHSDSSVRLTH